MRIIARKTLRDFWQKHKDTEQPLRAWFQITKKANWINYNEIKALFPSASLIGNDRVVFNIKGNNYRLVVRILFNQKKIFIRFIGTHNDYNKIDVKKI